MNKKKHTEVHIFFKQDFQVRSMTSWFKLDKEKADKMHDDFIDFVDSYDIKGRRKKK